MSKHPKSIAMSSLEQVFYSSAHIKEIHVISRKHFNTEFNTYVIQRHNLYSFSLCWKIHCTLFSSWPSRVCVRLCSGVQLMSPKMQPDTLSPLEAWMTTLSILSTMGLVQPWWDNFFFLMNVLGWKERNDRLEF